MTDIDLPAADLVPSLTAVVGEAQVVDDPALMEQYVVDWARRFRGPALAVVRPGSTQEVSALLRLCSAHGVPVIAQGGNTGLVGGSVPAAEPPGGRLPVIMSLRRLDAIGEVDHLSGQVSVGAGEPLQIVCG